MYGIVICPKCGRPQGVNLGLKTTTCQCGTRLVLRGMKILFSTDDARELPEALGRVRAELSGNLDEFERAIEGHRKGGSVRGRSSVETGKTGLREKALEVLNGIAGEKGFKLAQAEDALEARGLDAPGILSTLLQEGLIYEFKRGVYKPV